MRRVCLLFLGLLVLLMGEVTPATDCGPGYKTLKRKGPCVDANECEENQGICGDNSECTNTPGSYSCTCKDGFIPSKGEKIFTADQGVKCVDVNECTKHKDICGDNSECTNTVGSYYCICKDGFVSSNGKEIFTADQRVTCVDRDECEGNLVDCGRNAVCKNTMGSYYCTCEQGYRLRSGQSNFTKGDGVCEDVCIIHESLCGEGDCKKVNNDYECVCKPGFTNYGFKTMRCSKPNCEFLLENSTEQTSAELEQIVGELRSSCIEIRAGKLNRQVDANGLLERLLDAIDKLLSAGPLNDNRKVTALLEITEKMLQLLGPLLPNTTMSADHSEIQMLVRREAVSPQGKLSLSTDGVQFDSHWETAAGDSYLGFTAASLLRYKSLETSVSGYFDWIEKRGEEKFQINSDVVTAVVTNNDTAQLKKPIQLTFSHLKPSDANQTCVFWDSSLDGGAWSTRGCTVVMSNANQTVCSCTHLSSFAVLMSLYEKEDVFELQLITWIGLSLSLICLLICILTFCFVRSIKSTRTTIHLHLCISLFIADLVFLAGITRTENEVGCAFVAGLLHFFFLAAFCWMCLEGVQLFRMVVLVFNTTLRPLYLMAGGYGIPALIVAISAIANAKGYGTKRHCWLNLQDGFIWSFFGPVCLIIVVNIFFFLITVWKLAQKFSSLNQDLSNLHKIKSFTITAIAQLCVLGTMWIFGCFQFEEQSLVVDYIFTILNSLQGVLVFVMHCLFSKQVREEYAKILTAMCAPQKRKYSEFSTNQTSKSQGSGSAHHTGESHI
ncbi:adhesion G protein-coupled receptor E5-like [Salminus brasiliensis]|uniref:adhesion G protein-coupled receptor E5-like n=1 Tax=Salminus brasiliensis TaxID=930266 RepID=UPI003B8306B8